MFRELIDNPLPLLPGSHSAPSRRRHVGPVALERSAFEHFAELIAQLGAAPPDADQLASAARWLIAHFEGHHVTPCIRARMHVVAALRAMRAERYWDVPAPLLLRIDQLLNYLEDPRHLIPGALPVIGHLDDAILVDAVWPQLEGELHDYLEYRALRRIEAECSGQHAAQMVFMRAVWQREREALDGLRTHFRHSGLDSYASGAGELPQFHVH